MKPSERGAGVQQKLRGLVPNGLVNTLWHLPLAVLANIRYGFPAKRLTAIGVTGTKGKTTVAHLIYHILKSNGKKTALISTIGAVVGGQEIDTGLHVTNPNPVALQRLLSRAVNEGCEYAVIEATSHGLDQHRNWGIPFAVGVVTQVTSDHLEYHGGETEYRKAKAKLIAASETAVVNGRDPAMPFFLETAEKLGVRTVIYKSPKEGPQSQNVEASVAAAVEIGIAETKARAAISTFPGVPGRMEVIEETPFTVIIDFAHTPQSLEAALKGLRARVGKSGRLVAVFGCAGERDRGRRKMGEVAARYADCFVITAEDPRRESVEEISRQIAAHAMRRGAREVSLPELAGKMKAQTALFARIPDRKKAIEAAIAMARPGDVIGLFGKGHEKSMCFGRTEYPWSEHDAVRMALRKRGKQ